MKRGVEKVVVIGYWLGWTTTPQFQRSSPHQNQFYERRSKWQWLSITTSVRLNQGFCHPSTLDGNPQARLLRHYVLPQ